MIILGIDPGTATTGFGVIEEEKGKIKVVDFGTIDTKPNQPLELRLEQIHAQLNKIITQYNPDEVAVEELFFTNNQKTAIAVGQARGVILLTARLQKVPLFEYTPLQVKNGICGYGGADKKQVQKMVQMILNLKEIPKPDDAADALAIAVCHQASRKMNAL
jgi:crossover junction endodeoxyribonuclease RuvC